MNNEENLKLQLEEIDVLNSIYGNDWQCENQVDRVYNLIINNENTEKVVLQVVFCDGYPLNKQPIFRLNAPWLSRKAKDKLLTAIEQICFDNPGQQVVFLWSEKIKEFLFNKDYKCDKKEEENDDDVYNSSFEDEYDQHAKENKIVENESQLNTEESEVELPEIIHGEPFTDRKSTFQAHLARVKSRAQVKLVLDKLKENKKVANATHNIMAYRIRQVDKNNFETIVSNCDDDGETGASSRMLFLMKTLNAIDVIVVVSRWFGGILLGQDRFKHINTACATILRENGLVEEKQKQTKNKKKN